MLSTNPSMGASTGDAKDPKEQSVEAVMAHGKKGKSKLRAPTLPDDTLDDLGDRHYLSDYELAKLYGQGPGNARAWIYPSLPWGAFQEFDKGYLRGKYYILWELTAFVLAVYSTVDVPYMLAFRPIGQCMSGTRLYVDVFSDIFFAIDIVFQFNTAHFVLSDDGTGSWWLIDDLWSIYMRYCFSFDIQGRSFFWDFLGILPFHHMPCLTRGNEVAQGFLVTGDRFLIALRMVRSTKMWRCWRMKQLSGIIDITMPFTSIVVRVVRIILIFFLSSHIIACIWWSVGWKEGGWVSGQGLADELLSGQSPLDWVTTWLTSFYWAVTTVTTIGYGDITPSTNDERIFALFSMIIGATFFAWLTGNVTNLLAQSSKGETKFTSFISQVSELMELKNFPEEIRESVLKYYASKYPARLILNEESITGPLPVGLRKRIVAQTYLPAMETIPLFQNCTQDTLLEVCALMESVVVNANTDVTLADHEGEFCFVVLRGSVKNWAKWEHDNEWVRLPNAERGGLFGELAIFGMSPSGRRLRWAKTSSECELLKLTKMDIKKLMLERTDLRGQYRRLTIAHLQRLALEATKPDSGLVNNNYLLLALNNWMYHTADTVATSYDAEHKRKKPRTQTIPQQIQTAIKINCKEIRGIPRMRGGESAICTVIMCVEWEDTCMYTGPMSYMQDEEFSGAFSTGVAAWGCTNKIQHNTMDRANKKGDVRVSLLLTRYRGISSNISQLLRKVKYEVDKDIGHYKLPDDTPQEVKDAVKRCSAEYLPTTGVYKVGVKPKEGEGEADFDPRGIIEGSLKPYSKKDYPDETSYPVMCSAVLPLRAVLDGLDGSKVTLNGKKGGVTLQLHSDVWRILAPDSMFRTEVLRILHRHKHKKKMLHIVRELRDAVINMLRKGISGKDTQFINSDVRDMQIRTDKIIALIQNLNHDRDGTTEALARIERRLEKIEKRQLKELHHLDKATDHREGAANDIESMIMQAESRAMRREQQILDTMLESQQQIDNIGRHLKSGFGTAGMTPGTISAPTYSPQQIQASSTPNAAFFGAKDPNDSPEGLLSAGNVGPLASYSYGGPRRRPTDMTRSFRGQVALRADLGFPSDNRLPDGDFSPTGSAHGSSGAPAMLGLNNPLLVVSPSSAAAPSIANPVTRQLLSTSAAPRRTVQVPLGQFAPQSQSTAATDSWPYPRENLSTMGLRG